MKSERWIRSLACRWCLAAVMALLACLLAPSRARAQTLAPDRTSAAGAQTCPEGYVRIEPGTFMMGSPTGEEGGEADETQHRVTITRAYCMKATEVTQGEWQAVMGSNPSGFNDCGANCPVALVSWNDAVGYANALSRREGLPECYAGSIFAGLGCRGYRLPTEAEWEYAARAGTTGAIYSGKLRILEERNGPALDSIAWYGGNSGVSYDGAFDCSDWVEKQFPSETCGTRPVRQKQPNAWGLYDMIGNVWEWTGDWYGEYPGVVTDSTGAAVGSHRVARGGSWFDAARSARAANRNYGTAGNRDSGLGFRLTRTAPAGLESSNLGRSATMGSSSSGATGGCPAGYVRIAPGTFMMGSPTGDEGRFDDENQHRVTITRAYCMKATEATQGEWQSVMGSNPSYFTNCGGNCPVERVSWEEAVGYANALSRREGLPECYAGSSFAGLDCAGYRLPTEAEWEFAVRAGTTGSRYGNLDSVAWYDENSGSATHPVGQKQPNAWGLYDMLGNVWEWTGDWYVAAYPGTVTDPLGAGTGSNRVFRGGSLSSFARGARAAVRNDDAPGYRFGILGFRLSRTASSGSESVKLGSSAATESSSLGGAEGCPAGYVRIAAGAFTMGSPSGEEGRDDDETQQRVTISRGYCMKSTEVTQGEWQALMWSNPSVFKNCGANCPVERVSWEDAVDFANALSRRERLPECYEGSTFTGTDCRGYRLPTEVEWEYAARAGTMGVAYGTLDSVAWYDQNAGGTTHEVRKKQPNAWGLYDMLGNVWEWTGDWYTAQTAASSAPTGASGGSLRVFRGGSWSDGARYARAANRDSDSADDRYSGLGFRLVRTMP
jgi:formylglycine-generating enzyme required for sulfatase activity